MYIDEKELKRQLAIKDMSLIDYANYLGISKVTLYRKMNGKSDFFRGEIVKSQALFGKENTDTIFFTHKVT